MLKIEFPYDPVTPFLGVYPRELKTYVHTKTCAQMFIAALFIAAKKKNGNYPNVYQVHG